MLTVAVVDYGVGNIGSISRALTVCGAKPLLTDREEDFKVVDACVLPGVGAFGDAIGLLRQRNLDKILEDQIIAYGIPILGVCLGMQLLATTGLEYGEHRGLGWIPGTVRPLRPTCGERIPHVGWNNVDYEVPNPLLADIPPGEDFYFVHSFHFAPDDPANAVATTPYCGEFVSVVNRGNVYGTQFHPEKSQAIGLKLLKNFIRLSEES
ncbi:imidazole glycerol phosphate synthase subunit HisH [Pseudodesulfovibrio sp.]|uniref:imidazole glycerol phosphate synthase subunit HisH n=1 Tax=Pseudodesulfovibrio sp. TaxID=2035812 RepID=UPI00260FA32F|nr:imidazole glycerol phosphate synthase subunit HisH [Pseudodesulfovibrio sp.]MDD3311827.1 imidazole glycerol phosphate synthase subunit HisH [Pseudodesulfovibrio sp.]